MNISRLKNGDDRSILIETSSYRTSDSSQNKQLLQLLRDCYMVLLQTLLLLYHRHAKLQILITNGEYALCLTCLLNPGYVLQK